MKLFTAIWILRVLSYQYAFIPMIYLYLMLTCLYPKVSSVRLSPMRLDKKFVIKDYEIVYPVYVGRGETTLTADTPKTNSRQKRDKRSASGEPENQRLDTNLESTSHLNISGLGQTFSVRIESNKELLAPGFQVYYHSNGSVLSRTWPFGSDSQSQDFPHGEQRHVSGDGECLFRGDIINQHFSKAAFSLCQGRVYGMIMLEDEDYVIEPVPSRQRIPTPVNQHSTPHVMYRASSLRLRQRNYEADTGFSPPSSGLGRTSALEWMFDRRRRRKRAAYKLSQGLTAELLVVADKSMYYAHKKDDVIMYTLSIMNIVSQLYKDSSLGTTIKITLVGLVIMQSEEPKLKITNHAGQTLQNFCQWQSGVTGTYGKHDHAVLLTALDICSHKNQPCDTLGYAPIDGMCDSTRSCSINEDTGLSTGYTVAHEIGHNLGMLHDGMKGMCPHAVGTIMSPKLTTGGKSTMFKWSSCSRNYLIKFLHTHQAKCLWKNSLQVSRLRFPQKLPGEIYSANQQCAWLFGKGSKHCIYNVGKNLCQHLWCQSEGHLCQTKYLPAADGTECGSGKWCVQGQCVYSGQTVKDAAPTPVNGAWSAWGKWSDCSRSCGGGVRQRERRCDNPRPLYGGDPCDGISRSYRICKTQECNNKEENFRSLQCRRYERRPFHGSYYKWRPYTTINQASDQCKLYCQALGYDFITALANQVQDGTPCNQYSSDVCVEGSCKSYGCDWIIDSVAKEDNCGVCRGDNSTCRLVKGEFRAQPIPRTYFPITVIPKQARHIHISEKAVSHNYLAIRDIYGNYYLNGNMNMNTPGVYTLGGAHFEYRRSHNDMKESLSSKGPLKQDIVLEVLIMGGNPGVEYDYTLPTRRSPIPEENPDSGFPPREDYTPPHRYHPNQYDQRPPHLTTPRPNPPTQRQYYYSWRTVKSNCSETCGEGEQMERAECRMNQRYHVNAHLCDHKRRPFVGKVSCNTQPCEPRWVAYEWRSCSRTCGGGKQVRKIRCRQRISAKVDQRVEKRQCSRQPKPARRQWCNTQNCPSVWVVAKWSVCSVTCGNGIQTRTLSCGSLTSYGFKTLSNSACQHLPRHVTEKQCRLAECQKDPYQWAVSSWSKCSSSCGVGMKTRTLRCSYNTDTENSLRRTVDRDYCSHITPPSHIPLQEVCTTQPCPLQHWHVAPWNECSVTCGTGVKSRLVYCRDIRSGRHTTGCDWRKKPIEKERCNTSHCPIAVPYRCVDQFNWCDLVPKHNVCRHTFYGTRCCHSCRGH